MKKNLLFIMILALSLSFAGCGKKDAKQASLGAKDEAKGLKVVENNTLMGWLKRGKAVECRITTPEGEVVMIAKDNKVRMEGIPFLSPDSSGEVPQTGNGVMLSQGEWTYMWDKESKKGTKMNMKKMQELAGETQAESQANQAGDWEEMVGQWESAQAAYDCREISASDSDFAEPADVEFSDLTQFLTGMAEIGQQMEEKLNSGEEPDMKALEAIGKQLEAQNLKDLKPEQE